MAFPEGELFFFQSLGTDRLNLISGGINEGVFFGYDFPQTPPANLTLQLDAATTGKKYIDDDGLTIIYSRMLTKQAVVIQRSSIAPILITPTGGAPRIDAIIVEHERVLVAGGVSEIMNAVTVASTDIDTIKASLASNQHLIGVLELPINCNALNQTGVKYTKVLSENIKRDRPLDTAITDFNTVTDDGIIITDNYSATNAPPFPSAQTGTLMLEVFRTENNNLVFQRASNSLDNGYVYIRYSNDGGSLWTTSWGRYALQLNNSLTSTDITSAATANAARVLKDLIDSLDTRVSDNETNINNNTTNINNNATNISTNTTNISTNTTNISTNTTNISTNTTNINTLTGVVNSRGFGFDATQNNAEINTNFTTYLSTKAVYGQFGNASLSGGALSPNLITASGVDQIISIQGFVLISGSNIYQNFGNLDVVQASLVGGNLSVNVQNNDVATRDYKIEIYYTKL